MASIILDSNVNKIQGDFDNSTVNNRTTFQTSTNNATTGVYAVPNGTATAASWQASNNADPTNASKILIASNGTTDVQLVSGKNGTGSYLPLSIYNSGDVRFQVGTSGELGVRNGVGTVNYGTAGQVLASGGTGASPTWSNAGGMTLLGTITPTAVNSISLGSLTLTSYKALFIAFNNINTSAAKPMFYINQTSVQTGGGISSGSAGPLYGTAWLDLTTGVIGGQVGTATIPASASISSITVSGLTTVTTASTAIYFRCEAVSTFTAAGSIYVYGVQ
jgi:hypothetical protein